MWAFKQNSITLLFIAILLAGLVYECVGAEKKGRQHQSFDADWRFYAGEISGAERPEYNDASWLKGNVPQDWSIEGVLLRQRKWTTLPIFPLLKANGNSAKATTFAGRTQRGTTFPGRR